MAGVPLLFGVQGREGVYYIPKGMGAAVSVHCLRGSADPRPVLHSRSLKSLLGLGCSSAKGKDPQMLLIVLIYFSKGRMLVPRKRVGVKGQSMILWA